MSTIRVNKTKGFTVMSNHHLRDKNLSLKAKGLMSVMLSLPDDWHYSIGGLVAISVESESAIKSTLNELKKNGYLVVTKLPPSKTESGRFEYIYDVYEHPVMQPIENQPLEKQAVEKQGVENQPLENLSVENRPLYKRTNPLNTDELNTDKGNTDDKEKANAKHQYGEYRNVLLSDQDLQKLKAEFPDWNDRIERLSEYMASTGKSYKNHLATIRVWARKDKEQNAPRKQEVNTNGGNGKSSFAERNPGWHPHSCTTDDDGGEIDYTYMPEWRRAQIRANQAGASQG